MTLPCKGQLFHFLHVQRRDSHRLLHLPTNRKGFISEADPNNHPKRLPERYCPSNELDTSGLGLLLLTIIDFSDRDVVQIFFPGAEADGVATKEAFMDPLIAKPNGMLNLCVGAIYHIDGIAYGYVALESSAIRACFILYNVLQNSNDQPKIC